MFDLGFGMGEILFIGILALIFVGPRDLPKLMYEIGKKLNFLRGLADDFKRGMNEIVYQEEAQKLKAEILKQKAELENAITPAQLIASENASDRAAEAQILPEAKAFDTNFIKK